MENIGDGVEPGGQGELVVYQTDDGTTQINVRFVDGTVWLTQQQMADLFQTSRINVIEHIRRIYEEGELEETSTCRNFRQVRIEGRRLTNRELPYYNLGVIISMGYRVESKITAHFRRWATQWLKEHLVKGFTMDDARLKQLGGGDYWRGLPDRIHDIRSLKKSCAAEPWISTPPAWTTTQKAPDL